MLKTTLFLAHYPEAHSMMRHYGAKALDLGSIQAWQLDQKTDLVLTGEGLQASMSVAAFWAGRCQERPQRWLNLGVAGALDRQLKVSDCLSIRSVYAHKQGEICEFKSFSSCDTEATHDCLSLQDRAAAAEDKAALRAHGSCVDRELWGIAWVAHQHAIPWQSFKVISDTSDVDAQCSSIRDSSAFFSDQLLETYQHWTCKNGDRLSPAQHEPTLNEGTWLILELKRLGLHLTQAMQQRASKVLAQLSIRLDRQPQALFEDFWRAYSDQNADSQRGLSPKHMGKYFLLFLESQFDPHRAHCMRVFEEQRQRLAEETQPAHLTQLLSLDYDHGEIRFQARWSDRRHKQQILSFIEKAPCTEDILEADV